MIKITILKNGKGECIGFRTLGHAGFGDEGVDIVCAAASILVMNTVNAIEKFTSDETTLVSDDEDGLIEFELKHKPTKEATILLETMILGLQSIEDDESYKKYIDIIFEEV